MINTDRIIPVVATDLLTLQSRMLAIAGATVTGISATAAATGDFEIASNPANAVMCDEPLSTLNFGASVTSATVYFAPAYDYTGFMINGAVVVTAGAAVDADPGNFYSASLSGGTVTIAKIGL